MSKKKIMRIVAAVMACASIGAVGAFGLAGCIKKNDDPTVKPPVESVAVEGVELTKSLSLKVGESKPVLATVKPSGASNQQVTWSSDNPAVATVSSGLVTAKAAGNANITVTSKADGTKTATCVVTVTNVAPTGLSFANAKTTIEIGGNVTLTPVFTPENTTVKTVTWASDNTAVATVENGVVTGVTAGVANITATSTEDDSVVATCKVEVLTEIVKVVSISFEHATGTENTETEEKTVQLTPIFNPTNATNKNVTWTSDNEAVASVDKNGLVTAHKKSGTAVITATTEDGGHTAIFTLEVTGLTVTANTPEIYKSSADELETAFVEWRIKNTENVWFNVYCKEETASTWAKLDGPLVRQYKDYYRADMVGLKAGTYQMKVVPVIDDIEDTSVEAISNNITVKAHDRSGYAFVDGTSSGAYNDDGTLKANANIVYITEDTKDTVSLTVTGASANPCVGLQEILNGYKKAKESKPLCVRLIGNITDLANMDKGDIVVDGAKAGVTIEGIGNDATVNGWGIRVKGSSNVEIRNLATMNCNSSEGDNIGLQQDNDHVWVHNCDFFYGDAGSDDDQAKGDGALDTKTSTYITHSYNHFFDSGKCNLQGMKEETTDNYITYHHNWYDHSDSRHPRIRTCTVHVYNNYFDGNAKYGVGATMGSSVFVESNYFRGTNTVKPMLASMQGTDIASGDGGTFSDENGGIIKSYNNKYDGKKALVTYQQDSVEFDCYEASTRNEQVPSSVKTKQGGTTYNNFDTDPNFYEYKVETPDEAKASCERYAGRLEGGDFKWEFNDGVDDASYAVNTKLKSALTSYKSSVVKIGGVTVSTDGSTGGETGGETGGDTPDTPTPPTPPTPVEGDATIFCVEGDPSLAENGVTLEGNAKSLTVTCLGKSFKPLKMESATKVSFSLSGTYTIKLYVVDDKGNAFASRNVKVNGTKHASGSDGIVTVEGVTGSVEITKGDTCNLCYIILTKTA